MNYIKVKKLARSRQSMMCKMSGFEGPAKKTETVGTSAVIKGQITQPWSLEIPPEGVCLIPDTAYNRKKLKNLIENNVTGKPVFELLDDIDLNEVSKEESDADKLRKEVAELEKKKAELIKNTKIEITTAPIIEEPVVEAEKKKPGRKPGVKMKPDVE